MPAELTLEPAPSAARLARRWVTQELAQRARPELGHAAALGVSELVTNALLHVRSTIVVRLVDDGGQVRVEVYDESPLAPEGAPRAPTPDGEPPLTFGRGLQIVDAVSHAWGVSYEHLGKCVWFQPAPESEEEDGSGPSFEPTSPTPEVQGSPGDSGGGDAESTLVTVRLVDLPIHLFLHYRDRILDLQREMTLIALGSGAGTTIAHRLVLLAQRIESSRVHDAELSLDIAAAHLAGQDRTTVTFQIPSLLGPEILEFGDLLRQADDFCRDAEMLTLAAGPQETAFRSWYLGEMASQATGRPPRRWTGDFSVSKDDSPF